MTGFCPFFYSFFIDALGKMEEKHAGFVPRAYNGGKTMAYGFDMYLYPEVKINYNPDGTVSEEGKKNMP